MARSEEREPSSRLRSSVPVQPAKSVHRSRADPVPHAWLADSEHLVEAERVRRLEADFDLVTTLALGGFTGPDWDYFATEMARYGLAVIGGWMGNGLIFARCRARGYGIPQLERPFERDEITELSGETVAKAVAHYRDDVLMKQRWDYQRGASLKTYFIGQCLIRFPNVYRQWFGHEIRNAHLEPTDPTVELDLLRSGRSRPEQQALDRMEADLALAGVKNGRVRRSMLLTAAGQSQAEIADELDTTVKAVERMLNYERGKVRRRLR